MRRARVLSLVCLGLVAVAILSGVSAAVANASAVGADVDVVRGDPNAIGADANATGADPGRTGPIEQVPFGVRTMYGNEDLRRPGGGAGVTVAVIDTGIDRSHPDLERRVSLCRDFTGEEIRQRCTDRQGHGTHVAGTVAADGGADGRGIYGVAPEAEIYALKACDDEGRCSAGAVGNAVRVAADEGADVALLSLGGHNESRMADSIRYATSRGVIVVASSGNSGPELGSILYPAANGRTIGVGAAGAHDERIVAPGNYRVPEFSSRGIDGDYREAEGFIDVAAPGVGVLSPVPGGGYERKTGTSMAAPHVAGLTAKILGGPSSPAPADLRAAIRNRAVQFDVQEGTHARVGYDPAAGFGIPTVEKPLAAVRIDPVAPTEDAPFALDGAETRPGDSEIVRYEWDTIDDGEFDRAGRRIKLSRSSGEYTVSLRVTDADGATATSTRAFRVTRRPIATFATDPAVPTANETVRFDATGSFDPDGTALEYRWDLTGDGETDATDRVVETAFVEIGPRPIRLEVVDGSGAHNETTREVLVNDAPRLAVETPSRVFAGRDATLRASVENEIGTATVTWTLPDETATGETLTRAFPVGETEVRVTAEDEYGATATERVRIVAEPTRTWRDVALPAAALALLAGLGGYLLWQRSIRRRIESEFD